MFSSFAGDELSSSQSTSQQHTDMTNNVTEQFKFMHVSGDPNHDQHVQELAISFMSTLGINKNHPEHSEQLEKLTRQLSGMVMKSSEPVHINQTASTTAAPQSQSATQPQRSRSPKSRRDRVPRPNRSRSPMARFTKAAQKSFRSLSPRRRKNEKPQSPLANQDHSEQMAMEDDEFFDTRSTLDSFSPAPKQKLSESEKPPTPASRPPLATVNIKNSPIVSPQKMSDFKFDKEQDKFNLGISPPKKSKFGSPSKKAKSPTSKSPTTAQKMSPLQGSPLSDASPFMTSVKKQTTAGDASMPFASPVGVPSVKKQTTAGDSSMPFASPVPDVFHAPETFIGGSGSRGIPTPQNIMQNQHSNEKKSAPKTPFDPDAAGIPRTVPDTADTAETLIKKKTRNTATPNLGAASSSPMFNVDLSQNSNIPKGKRGSTLRKGFKSTAPMNFGFIDEIKEAGTDETTPTAAESPSNGSAVFMDTSPILSPPPQKSQGFTALDSTSQVLQGFNAPAQFSLGVGGTEKTRGKRKESKRRSQNQRSQSANMFGPSNSAFDLNHIQKEKKLANIRTDITALKDLGKACYVGAKYQECTRLYSQAIEKFRLELFTHVPCKDLLAVLLSNRAAALLMIGAFESAVEDCRNGILYVTDPRNTKIANDPDANPSLRPKLYTRMGRAFIKLGKVDDADRAFVEAIESATVIQAFLVRENITGAYDALEQIKTEAVLGQSDAWQLRKTFEKFKELEGQQSVHPRNNRDRSMECLGLVKIALNTANGCLELHLAKVQLLAELHRWREVCNHCERFAASNVNYDGCLIGDLASKNPFPSVSVAKYLRANYFRETRVDDIKGAEMFLNTKSAAEAILRLPNSMMQYYLRSLRLNEKYASAEACAKAVDNHIKDGRGATANKDSFISQFLWLPEERDKLQRTQTGRNLADILFSRGEFRQAALKYAGVLAIDSGAMQNATGCRLHAILHCNRAACFMAGRKHRDAMNDCTCALRIYPRYLKALLRRARCYKRLERTRESVNDFNHWLEIVKLARESNSSPVLGDCVFDGPHTIEEKEYKDVQDELNRLLKEKAQAEADERARQARTSYQEESQTYHSERFSRTSFQEENRKSNSERFQYNGKKSPAHEEARRRRENFYSSQNTSRRWDSFKDRSQSSRQEKPKPQKKKSDEYGYKSQSSPGGYKSQGSNQGSPRDMNDHYSALGIDRRATADEIKKAYKKMALKYHPDKNKDNPTAADNFLRIKDAYETLKDPNARRKYDSKSRRHRY